jgi:serine/threonine protein kinase
MAPEIHLKQPYQGRSIDLFAASIILFILVAGHPPFTTAEPKDPFYRCVAASRADIFWRTHCKNKEEGDKFFSEDFKDIIQACLQLDPAHRPSIGEVLAHKWMKGPMPTREDVLAEFTKRDIMVKKQLDQEKKEKEMLKAQRVNTHMDETKARMRSAGGKKEEEAHFDMSEESLLKPKKQLQSYEKLFAQNTEFFSTYNPDMIEEALVKHLQV